MLSLISININKKVEEVIIKLNENGMGILFAVDNNNKLKGIITDGDLRRVILRKKRLNTTVKEIMNKNFVSLNFKTPREKILSIINQINFDITKEGALIKYIPLVNKNNQLVDYASSDRLNFIPLSKPNLKGNELKYLSQCVSTNWISSQGHFVRKFEEKFSKLHKNKKCLAVSNGTAALSLSLLALDIKPGDEIIVPNLTFAATINVIMHIGAKPVIVDVDPDTWTIDPKKIKEVICSKTKGIIIVHLFGNVCNLDEILKIVRKYKLNLIEDCAEAIGSRYNNTPVGLFGDCGAFSFYGNKTITTGEGGMVIFKSKKIYNKAKILRDHGMSLKKRYWHEVVGYNYRMTNLQAAIGLAQLEKFKEIINFKIKIAEFYKDSFKNIKFLKIQKNSREIINSYWAFGVIFTNKKINFKKIQEKLFNSGIETNNFFYPLNVQSPYKNIKTCESLKNSINLSNNGILLPTFNGLKEDELRYIVKNFIKIINKI